MLQAIKNRDSQLLSQLIQSHITPLRRTLIERLAPKDDGLDRIKGLSGYIDDSVSK
jgi:hypothetical protein